MYIADVMRWVNIIAYQVKDGLRASMSTPSLPKFMIIGAQKSGTDFLHYYLEKHPRIKMARCVGHNSRGKRKLKRELHHFDKGDRYSTGIQDYMRHFPIPKWSQGSCRSDCSHIWGERTPNYICKAGVPERIQAMVPDALFIVLLRNPIDRAYSHYQMRVRKRKENRPFEQVMTELLYKYKNHQAGLLEGLPGLLEQLGSECDPVARGLYAYQLQKWFRIFRREQFHIIHSEEMFENPQSILSDTYEFLGVEDHRIPQFVNSKARYYPGMPEDVRKQLQEFYAPFNQTLCNMTGMNFGWT